MAQKLVIVESPAKANTIAKFLGKTYKVEASNGHIRDLPKSQLGIDVENNFEPKYITIRGRGEILDRLKKEAKKADKVYLATDPDREGEAISWHLQHILKMDENKAARISFNEITKDAVKNAIKSPRKIDKDLVNAQQARRLLDRLVGYEISPLLWRKVRKGLSAGRVQSVATRMVCDREDEIDAFVPEEYWSLDVLLSSKDKAMEVTAQFAGKAGETKRMELHSKEEVDAVLSAVRGQDFLVKKLETRNRSVKPSPPFTTSSLQQEAARRYGFSTRRTMVLAQQLYEGIDIKGIGTTGLVSYIRTDSVRVAEEAQQAAAALIREKYAEEYCPKTPNVYKGRGSAQDAHEAIRPTNLELAPAAVKASLSRDQHKLYLLIYNRFLASQMTPAVYETRSAHIEAGGYRFRTSVSNVVFNGYQAVYVDADTEEEEKEPAGKLDDRLVEGAVLIEKEPLPQQHFTQPPARYTEASLVRALEEQGIGRPSTYAPIISNIIDKGYVAREEKALMPTELGTIVTDLMKEYFANIVDVAFTAEMEGKLDSVEAGETDWHDVLAEFYGPFEKELKYADEKIEKIVIEDEVTDVICDKCGANMVIKMGRYGKFMACPNYPDCRNIKPILNTIDTACPKCGGKVVVRNSRKGRTFYGCDQYPACDFISWYEPLEEKCPECGSYMLIKRRKKDGNMIECSNPECKHSYFAEKKEEDEA
jgi:DNA topoisomerase-1